MQDALENEFPVPWETEAAFTRMLLVNAAPNGKCTFHRPDLWHTVNLGVGKTFVGGAVSVLEKAFPGRNRAFTLCATELRLQCLLSQQPPSKIFDQD